MIDTEVKVLHRSSNCDDGLVCSKFCQRKGIVVFVYFSIKVG